MSQNQPSSILASVVEILPNALIKVRTDYDALILAHFAAEARSELVRLLPGDRVRIELSPYHKGRGRIVGKA